MACVFCIEILWEFQFGCLHIVPRMVDYHNMLWTTFNLVRFYGKLREIPIPACKPADQGASLPHGLAYALLETSVPAFRESHVLPWLRHFGQVILCATGRFHGDSPRRIPGNVCLWRHGYRRFHLHRTRAICPSAMPAMCITPRAACYTCQCTASGSGVHHGTNQTGR